ncbi:MAG: YceI family protein, partial [Bdellovibrio sp.]
IRIKGIEKEIEGTYSIEKDVLNAQFKLKLADFKITGIKYMGVGVKDEVTVSVTVPIKKAQKK